MITIKVTSSFLVGGKIAQPGDIVEVTNSEAKDLLHRDMATLATADDLPEDEAVDETFIDGTDEATDDVVDEGDVGDQKPKPGKKK